MSVIRHEFQVFADYHQFYLWDAGANPVAPVDYTDDDVRRMIKVAPNVVVIHPVRSMTVPVEIEIHEGDPGYDFAVWDHIAECSLDLPTGQLHVEECTGGTKLRIQLSPATYAVRALYVGLDDLSDDGLEGDDRYRIVLWPGLPRAVNIVRQWDRVRSG